MKELLKRTKRLFLLGLTGAGKSRLGNILSGKKIFTESFGTDSFTKGKKKEVNQFGVEIIDFQGLIDTGGDDKDALTSIFSEIKENRPNVLAYVQNSADKRFGPSSKKAINEICQMFDTKSVWNHFIIVFTYADCISLKKRDEFAKNFSNKFLKEINEYYENHQVNDDLPIPKTIKYYFVELGDDDEYKLKQDTILELGKIMKLTELIDPISNNKEKIILKITTTKCRESLKKYDRYIDDENGNIKLGASAVGTGVGTLALSSGAQLLAVGGLTALGVTAVAPIVIVTGVIGGLVYGLAFPKIIENLGEVDFYHKVDKKYQNEDYIEFDEETYFYHDGSTETKRINIQYFTRVISK